MAAERKCRSAITLDAVNENSAWRYCHKAFLWELLPDNEMTLAAWGRCFGVSPRNAFALLSHIGEDLPGAIQIVPPENLDDIRKRGGVTGLSTAMPDHAFRLLVKAPGATQFTETGGKFSLAGAQPKNYTV